MAIFNKSKLLSGLYFVGTPIGTARDITLRALDVLASADVLAAEDTRSLRRLMDIHGIPLEGRHVISYHDHNGDKARPALLAALEQGQSVAYASEAGMPLIADPGYDLCRMAQEAGYRVTSAPGPTAVTTALTLAGLPTDKFTFAGFLPNAANARRAALGDVKDLASTLVFYESPKRIAASLKDCADILGADRNAALCRELTKKFEDIRRGTLDDLIQSVQASPPKGEIVLIISRPTQPLVNASTLEEDLRHALSTMRIKDAAETVAAAHGVPKRRVYQMALELDRNT